jgi:DNA-binding beta-propeller fold protein YncE
MRRLVRNHYRSAIENRVDAALVEARTAGTESHVEVTPATTAETRKATEKANAFAFLFVAIRDGATSAPGATGYSRHDARSVYTADQTSNTVSVIDPAENKLSALLGSAIRTGER